MASKKSSKASKVSRSKSPSRSKTVRKSKPLTDEELLEAREEIRGPGPDLEWTRDELETDEDLLIDMAFATIRACLRPAIHGAKNTGQGVSRADMAMRVLSTMDERRAGVNSRSKKKAKAGKKPKSEAGSAPLNPFGIVASS